MLARRGRVARADSPIPPTEAGLWREESGSESDGSDDTPVTKNLLQCRMSAPASDADDEQECRHSFAPIRESSLYAKCAGVMCTFCGAHCTAHFYCVQCSTGKGEDGELTCGLQLVAFCCIGNNRSCH